MARLVALTGAGGTGKTRLAVAQATVAHLAHLDYPAGGYAGGRLSLNRAFTCRSAAALSFGLSPVS